MLTIAKIKALEPKAMRRMVADGRGLWLEVHPSGLKSWRLRYTLSGRAGKVNLGRWPALSLSAARQRRLELMAGIENGRSPAEQRQMTRQAELRGLTVKAFGDRYLRDVVSRTRKNPATVRRYLDRDVYPHIGNKALTAVTKQDLREIVYGRRDQGREQAALAIRNVLKRLWDYAVELEITEINPASLIKPKFVAQINSRTRALNAAELRLFLLALEKAKVRRDLKIALELILLNLTRKSELRLARWPEFNLERAEWALPQEHSKGDTPLIIPLSRQSVRLLKTLHLNHFVGVNEMVNAPLFPMIGSTREPMSASTLNRALKRVEAKIDHFTVHDLRRTAATNLAEQEFNADWIEKALNHKLKGVRGVYNRAQYATQRREMLQAWADWLDGVKGK